jgi:hypothetical protein
MRARSEAPGTVKRLAIAVVVSAAVLGAMGLRARQQRNLWWARAEKLCACNGPALIALHGLTPVPMGGLERVGEAQSRSLVAGCNDLRAAVSRRAAIEDLRGAPLRVTPLAEHQRAQRDVARALGLTCGDEHRRFWEDLRAHHERIRTSPDDTPREIVRVSAEALRVRDAMCARRAVLAMPPQGYALTAVDADRQGRTCGE